VKRLVIIGGGGHGKVVADAAEACERWEDIVFYDDAWPDLSENGPWKVAGLIRSVMDLPAESCEIALGIGDNASRARIASQVLEAGYALASVVHPTACISRHARIGAGTVVLAGAVINIGARLGTACIVNTRAVVEHDCVLGTAVHISPGAALAGGVVIGDRTWVGIGACIRQQVSVGQNVTIGAGAVVVASFPENVTVVGNPARAVSRSRESNHEEFAYAK